MCDWKLQKTSSEGDLEVPIYQVLPEEFLLDTSHQTSIVKVAETTRRTYQTLVVKKSGELKEHAIWKRSTAG